MKYGIGLALLIAACAGVILGVGIIQARLIAGEPFRIRERFDAFTIQFMSMFAGAPKKRR